MELRGTVGAGLGTGKYFMAIAEYKRQFIKVLGWEPYEGTLNVYVKDEDIVLIEKLKKSAKTELEGFVKDGITFFRVKLIRARLPKFGYDKCAIVFPGDSHNQRNVIQVIAPDHLRKKFGLEDEDILEIEVLDKK